MRRDNNRPDDREDYFDDYWEQPDPEPKQLSPEDRERYYAEKDAYYARRDAYYARRDAYYAAMEEDGDEEEYEEEYWEDEDDAPPAQRSRREKPARQRKRRRQRHLLRRLLLLVIVAGLIALLVGTPPVGSEGDVPRETGHSTVLLVGTDSHGGPDTLMLLSLKRGNGGVRLLSIPPDTCAEDGTSRWADRPKGADGMIRLMAGVEELIGFAPDAWVTVDMECFTDTAEMLGGLDFRVPEGVSYIDETNDRVVELKSGYQHLSGEQVVDLARWYTGRGLGESSSLTVQRELLAAAREQWFKFENLRLLPNMWREFYGWSETDMGLRNILWVIRVLLKTDPSAVKIDVLPCRAVASGEETMYMVDRPAAYALLQEYDPFL